MGQKGKAAGAVSRKWLYPVVAIALAIISLPAAVAVDWHFSARMLQQDADSYALDLAALAAEDRLPTWVATPPGLSIIFANPPTQGAYSGKMDAVRVEARKLWTPPLPALFGGARPMTAHATAARPRIDGTEERPVRRVE
jgi:hypothetical protein